MFFLTTMGCLFPGGESVAMQKICATEIILLSLYVIGVESLN